jgi:hypothetical protein
VPAQPDEVAAWRLQYSARQYPNFLEENFVNPRNSAPGMSASLAALMLLGAGSAYANDDGWSPGTRTDFQGQCELYARCDPQPNPCVASDGEIVFHGWFHDVTYTRTRGTRARVVYTSKTRADGSTALSVPYIYGNDYREDDRLNAEVPVGSTFYYQTRIIRQGSTPPPQPTLPPPPGTIGTGKDWFSTTSYSVVYNPDGSSTVTRGKPEARNECRGRTKWDHDRNHWDDKEHD